MKEVTTPHASRREWIGLAVLTLACVLYVMDLTVLHLAVPRMSEDLKPSNAQLLWIIDIYGFLVAGFLITMGTLGGRIGRRRLLIGARDAFVQGLHLAAAISAAVAIAAAIIAVVLLRRVPVSSQRGATRPGSR